MKTVAQLLAEALYATSSKGKPRMQRLQQTSDWSRHHSDVLRDRRNKVDADWRKASGEASRLGQEKWDVKGKAAKKHIDAEFAPGDGLLKGMKWGAGAGAVGGLATGNPAAVGPAAFIAGGVGAGIGYAKGKFDQAKHRREAKDLDKKGNELEAQHKAADEREKPLWDRSMGIHKRVMSTFKLRDRLLNAQKSERYKENADRIKQTNERWANQRADDTKRKQENRDRINKRRRELRAARK